MKKDKVLSPQMGFLQMLVASAIGILMFFVPITIGGRSTILFDHAASFLVREYRWFAVASLLAMMVYGSFSPFFNGVWQRSLTDKIITLFKIAGFAVTLWYLSGTTPAVLNEKNMMPFLYEKLGLTVAMIIPVGALALAFLIGFGLLEMVGVIMQPVMRKIWKTPGFSAIDAVASFVGSYSIGLLLTDQVYKSGKYTAREAAIIATGFSTTSAAFMTVMAKTLNIMDSWLFFFWSSFIITFAITAISARLPPLTWISNAGGVQDHLMRGSQRFRFALQSGVDVSRKASRPLLVLWEHFLAGIRMASAILPSIMAIGLTGLLLAQYTPVFDVLAWLLYPFTWLGGLADPFAAAKGMASVLAELLLPAIILQDSADVLTRYVAAVTSVSTVIFFSGLIPCILATSIPVSVPYMLLIWLQRMILGILLASAFGHVGLYMGWLV